MYILYNFEQNYDGGDVEILYISDSKDKLEQKKLDVLKQSEQAKEIRESWQQEVSKFRAEQSKKVKLFLERNRDAIKHINKPKYAKGRGPLDDNAFAPNPKGVKEINLRDWCGDDGSPFPEFLKKKAQDIIIDIAYRNYHEFKNMGGCDKYTYIDKLKENPLILTEEEPKYPNTYYYLYQCTEHTLKIEEVEQI